MRRKSAALVIGLVMVGTLFTASPASASTCAVFDPELEAIVCDTVVNPTMRIVCTVINKLGIDCFA